MCGEGCGEEVVWRRLLSGGDEKRGVKQYKRWNTYVYKTYHNTKYVHNPIDTHTLSFSLSLTHTRIHTNKTTHRRLRMSNLQCGCGPLAVGESGGEVVVEGPPRSWGSRELLAARLVDACSVGEQEGVWEWCC